MDWVNLINQLQDWRAQLDTWGVTYQVLAIVAVVASIILLWSIREVVVWFLRVSNLISEIKALRAQVGELQKTILSLNHDQHSADRDNPFTRRTGTKKFNLDH